MMFLNRIQRESYLAILALWQGMTVALEDLSGLLTKEELKYIRMAHSFLRKALRSFLARIGEEQADRLTRDAKNSAVAIVPQRTNWDDETALVPLQQLYTLADHSLGSICMDRHGRSKCIHKGKDYRKCELYQSLMACAIPIAEDHKNECPYKMVFEELKNA